jgi:hypothetical protein
LPTPCSDRARESVGARKPSEIAPWPFHRARTRWT